MKTFYSRFKELPLGQRLLSSWTFAWFLLFIPATLLRTAVQSRVPGMGDLLFLSIAMWVFTSVFGIVLWLSVKGILEAKAGKSSQSEISEDYDVPAF